MRSKLRQVATNPAAAREVIRFVSIPSTAPPDESRAGPKREARTDLDREGIVPLHGQRARTGHAVRANDNLGAVLEPHRGGVRLGARGRLRDARADDGHRYPPIRSEE